MNITWYLVFGIWAAHPKQVLLPALQVLVHAHAHQIRQLNVDGEHHGASPPLHLHGRLSAGQLQRRSDIGGVTPPLVNPTTPTWAASTEGKEDHGATSEVEAQAVVRALRPSKRYSPDEWNLA